MQERKYLVGISPVTSVNRPYEARLIVNSEGSSSKLENGKDMILTDIQGALLNGNTNGNSTTVRNHCRNSSVAIKFHNPVSRTG